MFNIFFCFVLFCSVCLLVILFFYFFVFCFFFCLLSFVFNLCLVTSFAFVSGLPLQFSLTLFMYQVICVVFIYNKVKEALNDLIFLRLKFRCYKKKSYCLINIMSVR